LYHFIYLFKSKIKKIKIHSIKPRILNAKCKQILNKNEINKTDKEIELLKEIFYGFGFKVFIIFD
jgi:hypothetical protein